jgi:hypothetical protein
VVPSDTQTHCSRANGRGPSRFLTSQQRRKVDISTEYSNPSPTARVRPTFLKNAAVGNLKARKLVSAVITALPPANVDLLMQKLSIFSGCRLHKFTRKTADI